LECGNIEGSSFEKVGQQNCGAGDDSAVTPDEQDVLAVEEADEATVEPAERDGDGEAECIEWLEGAVGASEYALEEFTTGATGCVDLEVVGFEIDAMEGVGAVDVEDVDEEEEEEELEDVGKEDDVVEWRGEGVVVFAVVVVVGAGLVYHEALRAVCAAGDSALLCLAAMNFTICAGIPSGALLPLTINTDAGTTGK
jgi:hypothetical protein